MRFSDQQDIVDPPEAPEPSTAPRSQAQFFVPAPEDLPPPETVFGPERRPSAGAIPDPADRRDVHAPTFVPDPAPPGSPRWPAPDPRARSDVPGARVLDPHAGDIPAPPVLDEPGFDPRPQVLVPAPTVDPAADAIPDAPVLDPRARARHAARTVQTRPRRSAVDRRRVAVVYDVDGPRIRLGVAWFLVALLATISPLTLVAAVVYAAAAGLAARQLVQAWGSVPWQADVAAGLGAVPVLATLVGGTPALVGTCVVGVVVAIGCAAAPDGARMPGSGGRVAAMGIMCLSLVPAAGAAAFVLVRAHSATAAVVLLVIVSAYEVGDYIVGSGGTTPIEGPLAGITTATLLALPMALVLVEPYDTGGVALLGFTALACPLGQVMASAVLPGAGAPAPALRRIDTLLVLAPLWAAAAGAF